MHDAEHGCHIGREQEVDGYIRVAFVLFPAPVCIPFLHDFVRLMIDPVVIALCDILPNPVVRVSLGIVDDALPLEVTNLLTMFAPSCQSFQ